MKAYIKPKTLEKIKAYNANRCTCEQCTQKVIIEMANARKFTYTDLVEVLMYFAAALWYRQDLPKHDKPEAPSKNKLKLDTCFTGLRASFPWSETKEGYLFTYIDGKRVFLHNMLWMAAGLEIPEGYNLDHKNRNPKDNRIANLRLATPRQQGLNRSKDTKATYRGVILEKRNNKYKAVGTLENKSRVHFGYYDSPLDAALAFDIGRLYHYSPEDLQFVTLNFPSLLRTYKTLIENPAPDFKIKEAVASARVLARNRIDNLERLHEINPVLMQAFA
jgi:hypothetical protein